jgi:hypothetical protein
VFSYWQVIWTALHKASWIPLSPYPALVGTVFFLPFLFFGADNLNTGYMAFNFTWHVILLIFIEPDLRAGTVLGNALVFLVYLFFLHQKKLDF